MQHVNPRHLLAQFETDDASLADGPTGMERALAAEDLAAFYKEALDQAAIVAVTDPRGTIISVNRKFCELSGYNESELIGANHRILRSGMHDRAFFQEFYRTICQGKVWHGRICNRAKNGSLYWVETTVVPRRGSDGRIERFFAIRFDVTPQQLAERQLWRLANNDALTGLPNRLKFMRDLDDTMTQQDARLAVGLLDIGNFKDINDSMGHLAGDGVLCKVAQRIRGILPATDHIARFGGDEFALILRDVKGEPDIMARMQAVLGVLSHPIRLEDDATRTVSASLGIAKFPDNGSNSTELLKNADIALYAAKAAGRRTARIFTPLMNAQVQQRTSLLALFQQSLHHGDFEVYYQPIAGIDVTSGYALEALIRWNHPHLGLIGPRQFHQALKEENLAAQIDLFVLHEVLAQIEAWRQRGVPFQSIAVNVTVADLRTPAYLDTVLDAISSGRILTNDLKIEINENVLLGDERGDARQQIDRLHRAGVQIAFDDFGTGSPRCVTCGKSR
ncbi:MAG: diguanylate cyclase [Novosphingobium sp.]